MHILTTTSASLDDLIEPVDLKQTPADIVALSFTDSDLSAIAAAWDAQPSLPSLRLTPLRNLRHPMSVDMWIDAVAIHAKVVLVRILGGYDWWRYGCDRLAAVARERGIKLALLPGECRDEDQRLVETSTLPREELAALLAFFREGGSQNMAGLARRLAALAHGAKNYETAIALPKAGYYAPAAVSSVAHGGLGTIPLLFYRSMLLANDVAPIDALAAALAEKGFCPTPIFVSSLKDKESLDFVENALAELKPVAIVTATAFATGAEPGAQTLFDRAGIPVFQVISATTRRDAWKENLRGLAPADLAMHVVLPELDGRILAGAISFKESAGEAAAAQINRPEPDRIKLVATRISNAIRLAKTPRSERKLLILLPDYPSAPGRTGYAVGLDVPNSVLAMLHDLRDAGYTVGGTPADARTLLESLREHVESKGEDLSAEHYSRFFNGLPEPARASVLNAWGENTADGFHFRAESFGNVTVALAPDRGRSADRRADYHDPTLPPRHDLLAFGCWLQDKLCVEGVIHVGAHGTMEWLPGKNRSAEPELFPGNHHRRFARYLPFHRVQPRRSRASQAADLRHHTWSSATPSRQRRARRKPAGA
jgi:cobaltochelatase CobN